MKRILLAVALFLTSSIQAYHYNGYNPVGDNAKAIYESISVPDYKRIFTHYGNTEEAEGFVSQFILKGLICGYVRIFGQKDSYFCQFASKLTREEFDEIYLYTKDEYKKKDYPNQTITFPNGSMIVKTDENFDNPVRVYKQHPCKNVQTAHGATACANYIAQTTMDPGHAVAYAYASENKKAQKYMQEVIKLVMADHAQFPAPKFDFYVVAISPTSDYGISYHGMNKGDKELTDILSTYGADIGYNLVELNDEDRERVSRIYSLAIPELEKEFFEYILGK